VSQGVTTDDVLVYARRIIADFGWQRQAWPINGPLPRCIRAAIDCAAQSLELPRASRVQTDALRRVSEAIYGTRGSVGGIIDWEHYKRTNKEAVMAMLQKAIEMGPSEREVRANELWPT
jgi:hypothetical protein